LHFKLSIHPNNLWLILKNTLNAENVIPDLIFIKNNNNNWLFILNKFLFESDKNESKRLKTLSDTLVKSLSWFSSLMQSNPWNLLY